MVLGVLVYVGTGEVVSGTFAGGRVIWTITSATLNLLDCFRAPGIQYTNSPVTFTIL